MTIFSILSNVSWSRLFLRSNSQMKNRWKARRRRPSATLSTSLINLRKRRTRTSSSLTGSLTRRLRAPNPPPKIHSSRRSKPAYKKVRHSLQALFSSIYFYINFEATTFSTKFWSHYRNRGGVRASLWLFPWWKFRRGNTMFLKVNSLVVHSDMFMSGFFPNEKKSL